MPLIPRRLIAALSAFCLLLGALPATAQWVGAGRWDMGNGRFRHVVPGTWMSLPPAPGRPGLSIHAEAINHDGRLAIMCGTGAGRPRLTFDNYFGHALRRPLEARDIAAEPVALVIDGQRFDAVLAYDIGQRNWSGEAPWDPGFWDAFAWGTRMDLVNGAGEVISRFRLTNSGAARAAVRRHCGL